MFQLEAFRHATQGRLAELTGKDALGDDLIARRDYYTKDELLAQFAKFPPALKTRTQAYVDGMRRAVQWMAAGIMDPAPLYTHQLPLDRLGEALELTRTRPDGFMKALVTTS